MLTTTVMADVVCRQHISSCLSWWAVQSQLTCPQEYLSPRSATAQHLAESFLELISHRQAMHAEHQPHCDEGYWSVLLVKLVAWLLAGSSYIATYAKHGEIMNSKSRVPRIHGGRRGMPKADTDLARWLQSRGSGKALLGAAVTASQLFQSVPVKQSILYMQPVVGRGVPKRAGRNAVGAQDLCSVKGVGRRGGQDLPGSPSGPSSDVLNNRERTRSLFWPSAPRELPAAPLHCGASLLGSSGSSSLPSRSRMPSCLQTGSYQIGVSM